MGPASEMDEFQLAHIAQPKNTQELPS
jgi:hypothetical protein